MAELALFAIQASVALYQTIKSIHYHPTIVRLLQSNLSDLAEVLQSLTATMESITDIDLSTLEAPLTQCKKACEQFKTEIEGYSSRSGVSLKRFRDWAKLRYNGDDINNFQRQISNYQSTIALALADINLRKSCLTAEAVECYKDLVTTTVEDLNDHLRNLDEKVESIFGRTITESDSDAQELRRIKEERLATQNCIEICAQLTNHIDELILAPKSTSGSSSTRSDDPDGIPEKVTNDGLQECKNVIRVRVAKLEMHKQELIDRLIKKSKIAATSAEVIAELSSLEEELQATRVCLGMCSKMDDNMQKNISIIDNYGTGDSIMFLVSNNGKPIRGINRGTGWRNRMAGGYLSDASIQQLSRDFSKAIIQNSEHENLSPRANPATASAKTPGKESPSDSSRYGPGVTNSSGSVTDSSEFTADMTESSVKDCSGDHDWSR